jgi:hypothetical protein
MIVEGKGESKVAQVWWYDVGFHDFFPVLSLPTTCPRPYPRDIYIHLHIIARQLG